MPRFTENQLEFKEEQQLSPQTSFQRSRGKSYSASRGCLSRGVPVETSGQAHRTLWREGTRPCRLPMKALKALYPQSPFGWDFQIPGPAHSRVGDRHLETNYERDPKRDGHPIPRSGTPPTTPSCLSSFRLIPVLPGRSCPPTTRATLASPHPLSPRTPLGGPCRPTLVPALCSAPNPGSQAAIGTYLPGRSFPIC